MPPPAARSHVPGLVFLCLVLSASFGAQVQPANPELTAHEWGTFTSIASRNGEAVEWSTLNGSADLPRFVDHINSAQFKAGLRGTVRMETPVLYFYSPHETSVSVKATFSKGLLTEWYPQASHVEPYPKNVLAVKGLYRRRGNGSIAWDSVTVSPNLAATFPRGSLPGDGEDNQYYAARETSAAPLVVKTSAGDQQEKFLFYRGVSSCSIPISATVTGQGQLQIRNLAQQEIPNVILFERRGDKVGYRLGGAVAGELTLAPPEIT